MMKTLSLSLTACLVLTAASASAGTCFVNKKEYDEVKAQLPPLLRQLPLYMVSTSDGIPAALEIKSAGDKFVMNAHAQVPIIGSYVDSVSIRKVCVNGNTVTVSTNQGEKSIPISGRSVTYKGVTLTQTSRSGYLAGLGRAQGITSNSSRVATRGGDR